MNNPLLLNAAAVILGCLCGYFVWMMTRQKEYRRGVIFMFLAILCFVLLISVCFYYHSVTYLEPEHAVASYGTHYDVIYSDSVPFLKGSLGALTPISDGKNMIFD